MKVELTAFEARVLGCLIEKELTTPDQYPLSLNALTLAVNQKTNREPVMAVGDADVQAELDRLSKKHLVYEKSGFGSRVMKYQHRLMGTEFSELKVTPQERGILCVMLLRGPQTIAELRTRTNRLCEFADIGEVETVLNEMSVRDSGPLVVRLPRARGERESRYMHLLSGPVEAATDSEPAPIAAVAGSPARVATPQALSDLEARVADLEREVAVLKSDLAALVHRA
jgi:uncharacterized protein YceH (UPF0502 family)